MSRLKNNLKSFRFRLFISLCTIVTVIVIFLIIINNIILESVYLYAKTKKVLLAYERINTFYTSKAENINLEDEINKISAKNDFSILIINKDNSTIYSSNKYLINAINRLNQAIVQSNYEKFDNNMSSNDGEILRRDEKVVIRKVTDPKNNFDFIFLTGKLENGDTLYIRIQIESIEESVRISNDLLATIGGIAIIITSFLALYISRRFTKPILELDEIAKNVAKLDFSKKYEQKSYDNEINELGRNINIMSEKLETTIKQLRETNIELEKDIEEKSKIDEMRKQFISDVSHELKTPIALIQGYSEGLLENVNVDDESRKFYAEVIIDETSKMDKLVKQLLELMKLEYGIREFNNTEFDITELIKEVIRKCEVMIKENNIDVIFKEENKKIVYADAFYIDQVITNYFTNAIKYSKEVNNKKTIEITIEEK